MTDVAGRQFLKIDVEQFESLLTRSTMQFPDPIGSPATAPEHDLTQIHFVPVAEECLGGLAKIDRIPLALLQRLV